MKTSSPTDRRGGAVAAAVPATDRIAADLEAGRLVIETEAAALAILAKHLDASFSAAVERLRGIAGRIVVTGMGKSGHIARKVAATLASTGSPSLYVHPGEASHGDLGMITREDAVLAFSNSGNTAEMGDIIAYSRRFAIPLIAITAGAGSALAVEADLTLILPKAAEACPMGLAPTTSTALMLALGDALAITLLERRGFQPSDFREFHPGGTLGQKLRRARELMHAGEELPLAGPDEPMAKALVTMTAKSFGCLGAVDAEGRLLGVVTDGDLRRKMSPELLGRTVGEVMTAGPKTIAPGTTAAEALGIMNEYKITSLFVVEEGRPVGILHIHDCLRAGLA